MKPVKPDLPPAAKTPAAKSPVAPEAEALAKPVDLGLAERRKFIRTLPVPLAVESEGDTDWAVFQAPQLDKPPK